MHRPPTLTAASWIWLSCALAAMLPVSNILAATGFIAVFVGFDGTEEEVAVGQAIGLFGVALATVMVLAAMIQLVAAVKLRDGARWARVLLTISAVIAVVVALADITVASSWVLLVANIVAMVLAYSDSASDYLDRGRDLTVPAARVSA